MRVSVFKKLVGAAGGVALLSLLSFPPPAVAHTVSGDTTANANSEVIVCDPILIMLLDTNCLKGNSLDRKGAAGIGLGPGYGSGTCDGCSDCGRAPVPAGSRASKMVTVSTPDGKGDMSLTGGRSRAEVNSVIRRNMAALRHAYSRRLRDRPELAGRIVVRFAIDEAGKVFFAQIVESTVNDTVFEETVVDRVRRLNFGNFKDQKLPDDVTEVTYSFVFAK